MLRNDWLQSLTNPYTHFTHTFRVIHYLPHKKELDYEYVS